MNVKKVWQRPPGVVRSVRPTYTEEDTRERLPLQKTLNAGGAGVAEDKQLRVTNSIVAA
jgi:hypothetical protein